MSKREFDRTAVSRQENRNAIVPRKRIVGEVELECPARAFKGFGRVGRALEVTVGFHQSD